jgi:hypothetical protein
MIVTGMAIVAASLLGMAATWMNDRQFGGAGAPGMMVRSISLPVIAVAAGGSIWLASRAEDSSDHHGAAVFHGHPADEHGHHTGPGTQDAPAILVALANAGIKTASDGHVHDVVAAAGADKAAGEDNPMGEGNKHTHGTEATATAEQMLAAGKFALDVKEKTAKYTDVRDALADGYLQVTQDLPAIAAHFVRLDMFNDGHELNPDRPEVLLYTKRLDGTWRLVGAMFMQEGKTETPPAYFGGLDVWHRHENLCFLPGARVKTVTSAAECVGGVYQATGAYQMHVWVVPGGTGVFAHDYSPIDPGAFPGATMPAASELRVQAR